MFGHMRPVHLNLMNENSIIHFTTIFNYTCTLQAQEWVCVICSECPPDEGQSQDTWYEDDQSQQLQGLDLHTGQPMKSTLEVSFNFKLK